MSLRTWTGTFPKDRMSSASCSGSPGRVCSDRITSTRGTMCAGRKKCSPAMRSCVASPRAISLIGKAELLLVRTASREASCSSLAKVARFASSCSGMHSTTTVTSGHATSSSVARPVVPPGRDSRAWSDGSTTSTGHPPAAKTSAISAPILPPPITAARPRAMPSAAIGHRQLAYPVDMPLELVAGLDRSHACGGAGEDQVPRLQRDEVRQVVDLLGHAPDLHREVALLPHLAVHLEPDRALGGVADPGGRLQGRDRRRLVEALAHLPRAAHLLG